MPKRYYSTGEAAALLGLSGSRVRKLCAQGRIKVARVGANAAISQASLDRFMAIPRPGGRPRKVAS